MWPQLFICELIMVATSVSVSSSVSCKNCDDEMAIFYLNVYENKGNNDRACLFLQKIQNLDWWQLTWPWLVTWEPCNRVLNLHPRLLIQYALVSSCGHACLSGRTERLACVRAAGVSYFTACCQIKVCAADHRTGCCVQQRCWLMSQTSQTAVTSSCWVMTPLRCATHKTWRIRTHIIASCRSHVTNWRPVISHVWPLFPFVSSP